MAATIYYYYVSDTTNIAAKVSQLNSQILADPELSSLGTYTSTVFNSTTNEVEISFTTALSSSNSNILDNLVDINIFNAITGYDVYVPLIDSSVRNSYNVSITPSTQNDSNSGYTTGSIFTTSTEAYLCLDNTTGAANWAKLYPQVVGPGPQGNQGSIGLQGNQGSIGVQGNQGLIGVQGNQGLIGLQGNQGSRGNQGSIGLQGNQGSIGAQGNQGSIGTQGNQGSSGPPLPNGTFYSPVITTTSGLITNITAGKPVCSATITTAFTLGANAFTTIPLNATTVDNFSAFNTTTHSYVAPVTGYYWVATKLRPADNIGAGISYGLGANTNNNVDDYWFLWTQTNNTRNGSINYRLIYLTTGQPINMYAYTSTPFSIMTNGTVPVGTEMDIFLVSQ